MNKQLPLIALVSLGALGLSACGGGEVETVDDDVDVVTAERPDADLVTTDQPPLEGDSPFVDEDDTMMDDDVVMGDDTMMGGTMGGTDMMGEGMTVTVSGVQPTGEVYVALQDQAIFGTAEMTTGTTVQPTGGGSVEAMIMDVPAGDYAVAAFQDVDGDGQLTFGANGIPTEPWALSNGAGKSGVPSFEDAMMSFDGTGDRVDLELTSM